MLRAKPARRREIDGTMTTILLITLIAILVLLAISAFFSGSETALTAASKARLHQLAKEGDVRAIRVLGLIEDRERLIGGILLGNNLVNILASALATGILISFFGETGIFYATLIMTVLILIFAEVMPKTFALSNPDRMALSVGRVIAAVTWIFSPLVNVVHVISRGTLNILGVKVSSGDLLSAEEEIRGHIDLKASEGKIIKEHRDMLDSVLDFEDVLVGDVMVHRNSIMMINIREPADTVVSKAIRSPFTRIPLYRDNAENIVGVLHAKDILRAVHNQQMSVDIEKIMSEPWFVPETTTLLEQLDSFRDRRSHFALVVDEYGALMGLVTLEDILEEIVGEITDEHDQAMPGLELDSDGAIRVKGSVTLRDLNRRFDWSLPDEEAITIAGLLINESRSIPVVGECFSYFGFEFEVLGRMRNQITEVKIMARAKPAADSVLVRTKS